MGLCWTSIREEICEGDLSGLVDDEVNKSGASNHGARKLKVDVC